MDNLYPQLQVPSGCLTGIKFNVLTEGDIEKYSIIAINAANEVTDSKLGIPNPSSECSTCGAKDIRNCDGHFGFIKFPMTIVHPYYQSEIVKILNKVCPGCFQQDVQKKGVDRNSETFRTKHYQLKSCKYCAANKKEWYPRMNFKAPSDAGNSTMEIIVEVNKKLPKKSRMKDLNEVLPKDYWDFIPKDPHQQESSLNERTLSPGQIYYLLKDVDPRLIEKFAPRPEALFLSCFLVTPNGHRVMEKVNALSDGQKLIFDELTMAYKRLVGCKGPAEKIGSRVVDCLNVSKLHNKKSLSKDPDSSMSGLKWLKQVVLGKLTDNTFRMTVIGDPKIRVTEIGIPQDIAERLLIPEYLNSINWRRFIISCNVRLLDKKMGIYLRRKGNLVRVFCIDELEIGDAVYRPLEDGDIVLVNRPPSFHQHSLIALSVKILQTNSVVSINPICCSPLRGDFDGDCLHGFIPQSIDSRVELRELVALGHQLVDAQSGRNMLSLNHDSSTAAHLVTENGVFLNKFLIQQLKMLQSLDIHKAPSVDCSVLTGKQLFNMLLPLCFDFDFQSNDVRFSKGKLVSSMEGSLFSCDTKANIVSSLIKCYGGKAPEFLFDAQEVLCEWLSTRGFSVSLSDVYLSSDSFSRKRLIDELSCGLQEMKQICHFKQLMVDSRIWDLLKCGEENQNAVVLNVKSRYKSHQRSSVFSQVTIGALKDVFHDIRSLLYHHAEDSSLLTMVRSGSKGNMMKLIQQSLCLGLQHPSAPLSFRFPHKLSCSAWNQEKQHLNQKTHAIPECSESYFPCAVVENSFLTGLNPLECFVHSVSSRDSSFSVNADLPGTLTRKLMFFMRDLSISYDGTVRNAYGNQIVQFSYGHSGDTYVLHDRTSGFMDNNKDMYDALGGHPVGSLSACSISEAAYSALDHPVNMLESSPLLNLKNILECGQSKNSVEQSITLFLSKKLGRWIYGLEYGAIEVKSHLERLLFSDVVSTVMILFSPETCCWQKSSRAFSPWVCHFHLCKETMMLRKLNVQSVIDALVRKCQCTRERKKVDLSMLQILSQDCAVNDAEKKQSLCIVVMIRVSKDSPTRDNHDVDPDTIRNLIIPFLLGTVIKGFMEFKRVDILWKDLPVSSTSHISSSGELYLRVSMSDECKIMELWPLLQNYCLPIMDLIDWERSHPDNIHDIFCAYGIDTAWSYFIRSLKSAISDVGKAVPGEQLLLIADCLSATGEFIGLNQKGITKQRDHASISSPFMQACFSNPGACFIKAAKEGAADDLQGALDAVAWGKKPAIGTGGHFDIIYSGKGRHELAKPESVYALLSRKLSFEGRNVKTKVPITNGNISDKCGALSKCAYGYPTSKEHKNSQLIAKSVLRRIYEMNPIKDMRDSLRCILHKYPINRCLGEVDKAKLEKALLFHPQGDEKVGIGVKEIKVGYHAEYRNTRCFFILRTDGTSVDFSYQKCLNGYIQKLKEFGIL